MPGSRGRRGPGGVKGQRPRSRQRLNINICSTRDLTACCNSKSQRNLFLDSRSTTSTAVSLSSNVRNLREHDAIVDFSRASFTQA